MRRKMVVVFELPFGPTIIRVNGGCSRSGCSSFEGCNWLSNALSVSTSFSVSDIFIGWMDYCYCLQEEIYLRCLRKPFTAWSILYRLCAVSADVPATPIASNPLPAHRARSLQVRFPIMSGSVICLPSCIAGVCSIYSAVVDRQCDIIFVNSRRLFTIPHRRSGRSQTSLADCQIVAVVVHHAQGADAV